jgi:acyl-CoA thioesterase I
MFFLKFIIALALALRPVQDEKVILFFGDSLTAGLGLDAAQAFPNLIQEKIKTGNLSYKVINAGLSGETSAGGLRRVEWLLKQKVSVFVLELGANDALRGVALSDTRKNLQAIIDKVKSKNPDVQIVLAGMQAPPNLGKDYATEFKTIFTDLAKKNNAALIPFLLEGVGGNPKLNLPDGIHPTAEGHRLVAETVWKTMKPVLK